MREIGKFKAWCRRVLPAVYDDSLSYYEQLAKLVAKLNEAIDSINEIGSGFDELKTLYTELKNYVDHYFDNLDVQSEINNKLDTMAANGTLDKIINQNIFNDLNGKVEQLKGTVNRIEPIVDTLNGDVGQLKETVNRIEPIVDTLNGDVGQLKETVVRIEPLEQKTANLAEYSGADSGFEITRIIDTIYQFDKFVRSYSVEGYVIDNNRVCYVGPTIEINLDMPIENGVPNITLDSYLGIAVSSSIKKKSSVVFRPLFFDNAVSSGQTLKVLHNINVIGKHATPPINPSSPLFTNRQQIVDVAETYYQARLNGRQFAYGSNFITHTGNNRVNNENGQARMECDTFVSLVMLGLKYNDTPYVNTTANYTADFTSLPTNPHNYSWVLPWRENSVLNRKVTWTGGQNWWYWNNDYVFKNKSQLASGDIAIFRKNSSRFFDGITHTGVIKMVDNVPYIYHFTGSGQVESPMMYEPLSNVIARGEYDEATEVYFARPNYN